jgi:hypothetical protein
MKNFSKFLTAFFTFIAIVFFTFSFTQKAGAIGIFIAGVTINGVSEPGPLPSGHTIVANIGDHVSFGIVAYNNFQGMSLTYSGTPPAPFTFSPPLPTYSIDDIVNTDYDCPSLPMYIGSITFIANGAGGEASCTVNFDIPLPVELSSFNSVIYGTNVKLNWTTASEINNSGFDIERSNVKGQTSDEWTKISFVQGHGTTTSPNDYEFTDRNLSSGKYNYRLKQIDFNGNFEYYNLNDEVMIGVPEKFELSQNYPNPFNPTTVISYSLSENSFVTLKVYDVIGNEVATLVSEKQNSGIYNYQFSTVNYQLSSGVYFYKIEAGSFSAVKRMILIK